MKNVSMPIRPTSMVKMMISFPGRLSIGLKFRLSPTVLSADTVSNVSVNTDAPFSVTDKSHTARPNQQK